MRGAIDRVGSKLSSLSIKNKGGGPISVDKRIKILRESPFFQYLTAETIKEFADCFPNTVRTAPGKSIALDNRKIYIVAEGEIDLSASYPQKGSKIEAKGYLCRKRQGDIVNVFETTQDVERHMSTVKSHLMKDLVEPIMITADTNTLLLCGDMSALNKFSQTHPELSKPIVQICTLQIEDRLLSVPFLQNISKSKLSVLAAMCRYEAYDTNTVVFEEDDSADKLFLVLSGVAQVIARADMNSSSTEQSIALHRSFISSSTEQQLTTTRSSAIEGDAQHVSIAELKSGDYFGETALVFDINRTCGVRTADKCLFLTINRNDFDNFAKICPNIEESLKQVIKQRMVSKLSSLGIPFLSGITEDMLSSLAACVTIEEVPADHIIFKQGDVGDCFYIIVHGHASVTVDTTSDHQDASSDYGNEASAQQEESTEVVESILGSLKSGQYFGEMSLVNSDCHHRTATVTSTQKSILLSIDKDSFQTIFSGNKNIQAEFELRILSGHSKDTASLKHVLAHSLGVASFRDFLEAEHAGENIDFIVAVENYQAIGDDDLDRRKEQAKYIFVTFCAQYADRQVNIPHKMLIEIDTRLNKTEGVSPPNSLFDEARDEIYRLLQSDNFVRFLKSDIYRSFLQKLGIL